MLAGLASFGLLITNFKEKPDGSIIFYVSVPESSNLKDINQNQMAGYTLAKRFKECMQDMMQKDIVVKYKIIEGQHFDESMSDYYMNRMLELLKSF